MMKALLAATMVTLAVGCSTTPDRQSREHRSPVELAASYVDAYNGGDFDGYLLLMHPKLRQEIETDDISMFCVQRQFERGIVPRIPSDFILKLNDFPAFELETENWIWLVVPEYELEISFHKPGGQRVIRLYIKRYRGDWYLVKRLPHSEWARGVFDELRRRRVDGDDGDLNKPASVDVEDAAAEP